MMNTDECYNSVEEDDDDEVHPSISNKDQLLVFDLVLRHSLAK